MERVTSRNIRYKCDICEKDYARINDLKVHVKWDHDRDISTACTCDICGKSFRKPNDVRIHVSNTPQ